MSLIPKSRQSFSYQNCICMKFLDMAVMHGIPWRAINLNCKLDLQSVALEDPTGHLEPSENLLMCGFCGFE